MSRSEREERVRDSVERNSQKEYEQQRRMGKNPDKRELRKEWEKQAEYNDKRG